MSFDSALYMAEEGLADVIGMLISVIGSNVLSAGAGIAIYVFTALSLYTIAQRRGIRNPWMAWVPVLNVWILGSISDQYRYVVKGEVRNRRKVLMVLEVLKAVVLIASVVLCVVAVVNMIMHIPSMETMPEKDAVVQVLKGFLPALGVFGISGLLALISVVFTAMSYYDLFASCDPDNKVLYLVLGLLISITLPIFLFLCRNKDLGMPARRTAQPQAAPEAVVEAPEEPWTNPEE